MSESEQAGGSAPLSSQVKAKENQKAAESALMARLDAMEKMVANVTEENRLLKRQLVSDDRRLSKDPAVRDQLIRERLANAKKERAGKYRWAVRPPGWRIEVEFNCDFDNVGDAKRVYIDRFKTEFREDHAVNNHQIRRVGVWQDGKLIPDEQAPAAPKVAAGRRRMAEVR